ncbi:hypothetical protein O1611_g10447 [Lasiodiplodia mahajangana]|uniref:Uncharacterized protein n=1 Tax=Lasiodiplodia mahajangana TaxID=1108764 RepID=A0ACC2IYC8_9PEZI|nr:hypothetical protein O1611_g10447 [Lasiodiplodia mahajangana]
MVAFEPHGQFTNRGSFEIAQLISQPGGSNPVPAKTPEERSGTGNIKALIYVSENTTDGEMREEYILRIQKAIFDAEILGVSRPFISKYVTPVLDKRNEALLAPNHARTKRVKGVEKHEGQMAERPRSQTSDGNTSPLDLVDFQDLERANREPHVKSGLEIPTDMLGAIRSTRSKDTADEFKMTYIIVASEENGDSAPRFDILATSWDLELANALALGHFRDECSQSFPTITDTIREHWAKSTNAGTQSDGFNWKLDKEAYIQLDTIVPGSNRRITVCGTKVIGEVWALRNCWFNVGRFMASYGFNQPSVRDLIAAITSTYSVPLGLCTWDA